MPTPPVDSVKNVSSVARISIDTWHHRLGHPSRDIVSKVISQNNLSCSSSARSESVCDACLKAKAHQLPYHVSLSRSLAPLELIHSDVWGPAINFFGGYEYYVTFIDDYSKFTWLYLLRTKSEVFKYFQEFQLMVERKFNRKILCFQSDWGGEFVRPNSFFKNLGITHQVSCPHTHQQNGVAERKHRHIVEVGLALLATASMPLHFWDHEFLAATYLINRTPSKVLDFATPIHRLLHADPDYNTLRIFGCACWPNLHPYNKHKLQFRSTRCVFLGYSNMHKRFKCLDPTSGRIYISRDVTFDESIFPYSSLSTTTTYSPESLLNNHSEPGNNMPEPIVNFPTNAVLHVPSICHDFMQPQESGIATEDPVAQILPAPAAASASDLAPRSDAQSSPDPIAAAPAPYTMTADAPPSPDESHMLDGFPPCDAARQTSTSASGSWTATGDHIATRTRLQSGICKPKKYTDGTVRYGNSAICMEPSSYQDALTDPKWKEAIDAVYGALLRNKTWHLVPPQQGRNLIDCKWVFKLKHRPDGSIE